MNHSRSVSEKAEWFVHDQRCWSHHSSSLPPYLKITFHLENVSESTIERKRTFSGGVWLEPPLCAAEVGVFGHHSDLFAGIAKPFKRLRKKSYLIEFPRIAARAGATLHMLLGLKQTLDEKLNVFCKYQYYLLPILASGLEVIPSWNCRIGEEEKSRFKKYPPANAPTPVIRYRSVLRHYC